jgi:hypothetical protein
MRQNHLLQSEVKPFNVAIYWRGFTWNLRGLARNPCDLHGLVQDFDAQVTLKIAPAWKQ